MAATLVRNRMAALSALWWLFEGATILVALADTSEAETPPDPESDDPAPWFDYLLPEGFDLFVQAGIASYDSAEPDRAVLEELELFLDFDAEATYTDLLVIVIPAIDPGETAPFHAYPLLGVIQEPSPVTLATNQTKTYLINLYSEWLPAT